LATIWPENDEEANNTRKEAPEKIMKKWNTIKALS
jgi:hypothetical protein